MTSAPPRKTREALSGWSLWDLVRAVASPVFPGGAAERAALLAIGRHCDFEGRAWPSLGRIAKCTGFCKRRIEGAIEDLEVAGFLEVVRLNGWANVYRIEADALLALVEAEQTPEPTHGVRRSIEQVEHDETPEPTHGMRRSSEPEPAVSSDRRILRTHRRTLHRRPTHFSPATDAPGATEVVEVDEVRAEVDPEPAEPARGSRAADAHQSGAHDNANDDGGSDHDNNSPGMRDNGGPTIAQVADRIAAATARLGGGHAKRGRAIAEAFAKERLATAAVHELDLLAKAAGVPSEKFGDLRTAVFASAARDRTATA